MKTPEEMAKKYADDLAEDFNRLFPDDAAQPFIETFLAGYKAAQEEMLKYAKHVSSSGQMDILSPIPNDKRNFCRKGVVVMFEDLKRYTDSSQELKDE